MGDISLGFLPANALPPAPPREQELEALCSTQAARIEQLEDLLDGLPQKSQGGAPAAGLKPEERQALLQLLSDLREASKEQAKEIERLKKEGENLRKELKEAQRDITWIQDSVPELLAQTRREIRALAQKDPQPCQAERGEALIQLLLAHGGRIPEKAARQKMDLSRSAFSQLLKAMSSRIAVKKLATDGRCKMILLKAEN